MVAVLAAVPRIAGADCSQVVDQLQNDADAFHAEADKMGMDFTRDEFLDPALSSAKDGLKKIGTNGEPEGVKAVREGKKQIQDWQKKVSDWNAQIKEVSDCINDPKCSLIELMKKTNEDLRKWLESIASEGTAKAAERVNKASSMLESYNKRLASSAMSGASSAVSCMNQSSPEVAKANDPVDLRPAPKTAGNVTAPKPPVAGASSGTGNAATGAAAAKGGSHLGKLILVTTAVTAGVVGVAAAASAAGNLAACPSAPELAAQSGGGIVATGPDTICTDYSPCGYSYVRSCAAHICSPGSCSIYYQFNGGGIVLCSNACGTEAEAGSLSSAIVNCAYRAANSCQ
jgi:hypothetical protein